MKNEKTGIAVAGTILVDRINQVDRFPNQGELAKIKDVSLALGGCVPNVSIDIKALDKGVDVYAVGAVGNDDLGELVKSRLSSKNVDISRLSQVFAPTSFTEVISVTGGQRTFFTYNGANGHFGLDCIDFENLNVKMLHLGYFLLLDKVDGGDGVKILKEA